MAELLIIRHGQASFGAANYDALSDLGKQQARIVGELLRASGWVPDRAISGTLDRQIDTLAAMGFAVTPEQHSGFNEYDFQDLLNARTLTPSNTKDQPDRKTHFRLLRETVHAWMRDEIPDASESWAGFTERVEQARRFAIAGKAKRTVVVSSGGVIGQIVSRTLGGAVENMMTLNLQIKNTAMTRFVYSDRGFYLHEFNSTPHFAQGEGADMISYS
ncbi:histidine phosphatase family protein [Loktanella sp. S4079]|uniref:histidine phosphatase family protein n=1 Tax=Loktanella sp. S4079 TaxID=579483 RepID=UPI0005FA0889|nr:histidine phosphatase family protein [Loktanella sp. S4079]KJZ18437.1 phosphoglycerate mutase [Loktanella sp. S4079]